MKQKPSQENGQWWIDIVYFSHEGKNYNFQVMRSQKWTVPIDPSWH